MANNLHADVFKQEVVMTTFKQGARRKAHGARVGRGSPVAAKTGPQQFSSSRWTIVLIANPCIADRIFRISRAGCASFGLFQNSYRLLEFFKLITPGNPEDVPLLTTRQRCGDIKIKY
jgi:hypothetical protein